MKIKEVCEKTGLTDRAVRHYIRSGLVFPKYNENYTGRKNFNFCEGDVIRLKEIAVLRKYDLSIENIKSILDDETRLSEIFNNHIEQRKLDTSTAVKEINEMIEVSLKTPKTVEQLCDGLSNANYIPKQLPANDNTEPYELLYKKKKRRQKWIIVFMIIIILFYIFTNVVYTITDSVKSITSVSDSSSTLSCVVAEDYSSIKYYNDTYIPIDLGELNCAKAEILDEMPDFESRDDKNVFERFIYMIVNYCTIYAVKNTYNNSMIMIDSEFISEENRYYVNEKYYKYYKELADSYSQASFCLNILNYNGNGVNVSLNKEMTDYLKTISETSNEIEYNISALSAIEVNALDKSGIFYKTVGSINQCGDDYYYIDYNDYDKDEIPAYKIDSSYNKYLDEQFDFYNWFDDAAD
ncbi:MAG: MerR family transcriptional regulator [Eubacterium sp.]